MLKEIQLTILIAHPHVRLDMETWKCDHQVLLQYFLPKIHFCILFAYH